MVLPMYDFLLSTYRRSKQAEIITTSKSEINRSRTRSETARDNQTSNFRTHPAYSSANQHVSNSDFSTPRAPGIAEYRCLERTVRTKGCCERNSARLVTGLGGTVKHSTIKTNTLLRDQLLHHADFQRSERISCMNLL